MYTMYSLNASLVVLADENLFKKQKLLRKNTADETVRALFYDPEPCQPRLLDPRFSIDIKLKNCVMLNSRHPPLIIQRSTFSTSSHGSWPQSSFDSKSPVTGVLPMVTIICFNERNI
jgi:hypothetical protein